MSGQTTMERPVGTAVEEASRPGVAPGADTAPAGGGDVYGELLDHEYDGIREYDNPTPGWWYFVFILTIVFSVFYGVFFHFSPLAWTPQSELARIEVRELKRQFAEIGDLQLDTATVVRMMGEEKWMSVAASIYAGNCASCHGSRGEGTVGPNLTDEAYKNVRHIDDIGRVINDGAAAGAMPAWRNRLHKNEVVLLSAYVASLRGRNVPGRAPEGEAPPAWPGADGR